jgi:hypothetical protein
MVGFTDTTAAVLLVGDEAIFAATPAAAAFKALRLLLPLKAALTETIARRVGGSPAKADITGNRAAAEQIVRACRPVRTAFENREARLAAFDTAEADALPIHTRLATPACPAPAATLRVPAIGGAVILLFLLFPLLLSALGESAGRSELREDHQQAAAQPGEKSAARAPIGDSASESVEALGIHEPSPARSRPTRQRANLRTTRGDAS